MATGYFVNNTEDNLDKSVLNRTQALLTFSQSFKTRYRKLCATFEDREILRLHLGYYIPHDTCNDRAHPSICKPAKVLTLQVGLFRKRHWILMIHPFLS